MINPLKAFTDKLVKNHYTGSDVESGTYRNSDAYYGDVEDHVSMYTLTKWLKRDVNYNLSARTMASFAVGKGFYLTAANMEDATTSRAFAMIEEFADYNDLDTWLQTCALDAAAFGNSFTVWKDGPDSDMPMIKHLPAEEFTQITTDAYGDPLEYYRQRNMKSIRMPASDVLHFAWQKLDGSGWGEGMGQIMARKGYGFQNNRGETVYRPSHFKISEMLDKVSADAVYAGIPKHILSLQKDADPETVEKIRASLAKLDPNQHYVANREIKASEMALTPTGRFYDQYKRADNNAIMGVQNPISRLWASDQAFSYSSSQTMIDALFPNIHMLQRALKRFIEQMIFKPILEANAITWRDHAVRIIMGEEDLPDMDRISQGMEILSSPAMEGTFNPESILDKLRDIGFDVESLMAEEGVATQINNMFRQTRAKKQARAKQVLSRPQSTEDLLNYRLRQ